MRLTTQEIEGIKTAFKASFLPDDHLWLFGSRVDDSKRGGDIDLYIETAETDLEKIAAMRVKFRTVMFDHIEEQRVDIVIKRPAVNLDIHKEARATGVQLV